MSAGGKIKLALFLLIIFSVVGFWYVGKKDKEKDLAVRQKAAAEIIRKDRELKALMAKSLANSNGFDDFSYSELPQPVSVKNLKTIKYSETVGREYGLNIASALGQYGNLKDSPVRIMLKALDQQDAASAEKLAEIKIINDEALSRLMTMAVPEDITAPHLAMINSLKLMSVLLSKMSGVLNNPTAALESSDLFGNQQSIFYAAINRINDYFQRKGLVFGENEKIIVNFNF